MSLLSLPDDLLLQIVSYLASHAHVASLSSQCRRLYRLCDMPDCRKYRRVILRTTDDCIRGFQMLQSILQTPRFGTYVRHLEFDRSPSLGDVQAQIYLDLGPPQVSLPPENLSRFKRAIDRAGFDINEADRVLNVLLQDLKNRSIFHQEKDDRPRVSAHYKRIHDASRLPFYAQALASLLVSVSPGLESLTLCPLGQEPPRYARMQREAEGAVFSPTGLFFKHFLDRANGRGHNLPFLQKLRTVRFLINSTAKYDPDEYQPFDLYGSLNLIRRLPAIESVRVDGIMEPIRSSIELPPRTANYSKIEIRHSSMDYPYLIHTIRSAKTLREFTYTIGGHGSNNDSIAMLNPDDLFRTLLEYWDSLEYLDLDVEAELSLKEIFDPNVGRLFFGDYRSWYGPAYFYEWEGELGERPEDNILLTERPPPTCCFLRRFTKLRSLSIGIHLLYYFARGIDNDRLSEEVFSLADRLPPNLESLRIYGYAKGMEPWVEGLPPHIFDDMLSQLVKEKDEKLPLLTHIAGIEELIDHAATLRRPVNPEDVWKREVDQWTEYEY